MKKIRVGIELNHVIRNINKAAAKHYAEAFDQSIDLDELDYKDNILQDVCKFDSTDERYSFFYEDYTYEIFGCAPSVVKNGPAKINTWLYQLTNQEEYDVEVFYYSLGEQNLSIQSTLFFLAKIGTRTRKVLFPKDMKELDNEADVLITANDLVVNEYAGKKKIIVINNNYNKDLNEKADQHYDSIEEFVSDTNNLYKLFKNNEETAEQSDSNS